ncbi:MAG: CBS domain-containing protein [Proteobacteria bacterium]|nr:CBS domain-containing protein [Pseudomonadota bacterium]
MIVSMWMTKDPLAIEPSTPVLEAAELMQTRKVRRLPVLGIRDGVPKVVGILSQTDIFRALPAGMKSLHVVSEDAKLMVMQTVEIMHRDPIMTTPEAPIEDVATCMRKEHISSLPVVRDGVLVGMITESDIFRAFASILATEKGDARVTFDVTSGEDVLEWLAVTAKRRGIRVNSFILAEQHERPVCVVRASGKRLDAFLDDLWKSGHKVINVLRVE